MCKVCKRRGDLLLHPYDEEREKKGVEEVPAESSRILPENLRGRCSIFSAKERWYDNIVLNIPHASIDGLGTTIWDNKEAILSEVRRWTDWFTDYIFIPETREGIKVITADYSRFVVDVKRLSDDPLEKDGRGVIYTEFNNAHRFIEEKERLDLVSYYYSYINRLKELINEHSLLIDCHSFPSDISDVDICIGYNDDDWSKPTEFVIELVTKFFNSHGYKVGINSPYADSVSPTTGFVYSSIMIDVNKRIYLNEQTLELNNNAIELRKQLSVLYGILLRYNEVIQ